MSHSLMPCQKYNFYPDKSRGQNFLIDKSVLAKIIAAAELDKNDTVLEIGAGLGVLTQALAQRAKRVIALEVDKKLISRLKENLANYQNVSVKDEDVLKIKLETAVPENYKLVANIPYNLTSAILAKFFSADVPPRLMVLLVQKEVAERVCAYPGQMSMLSVMVQYYGEPSIVSRVPANAFYPVPKVSSAILKIKNIKKLKYFNNMKIEENFFHIVALGLRRRRKMLKNNLKEYGEKNIVDILTKIGLSPTIRPQELSIRSWVKFVSALNKVKKQVDKRLCVRCPDKL